MIESYYIGPLESRWDLFGCRRLANLLPLLEDGTGIPMGAERATVLND